MTQATENKCKCGKPMVAKKAQYGLTVLVCDSCGTAKPYAHLQHKLPGIEPGRQAVRVRTKRSEHDEQAALFDLCATYEGRFPILRWVFAIPNGALCGFAQITKRNGRTFRYSPQGEKLKREGRKAGVPDIHLPMQAHGYIGLWIEMKLPGETPSAEQKIWQNGLRDLGHFVTLAYSTDEAWAILCWYAGIEPAKAS